MTFARRAYDIEGQTGQYQYAYLLINYGQSLQGIRHCNNQYSQHGGRKYDNIAIHRHGMIGPQRRRPTYHT
jgi:hypothetical protein